MGCLVQVCARLTPVRAVVAPTQGGLSPPWALVTLLVPQSWGAHSVSTLRTESAVSLSAWLCAGPRVLSRCFLGGRMPSQWVPGSVRLRGGRGGAKMMVRAPACNLDPLSWLLEGLHRNSSGPCSALSGLLACLRGQVWGAAPSAKALSVGRGLRTTMGAPQVKRGSAPAPAHPHPHLGKGPLRRDFMHLLIQPTRGRTGFQAIAMTKPVPKKSLPASDLHSS